ncbi:MAG: methylenetetrahydrofolate reductase, partial [Mycobacteriaceae bacterium]
MDEGREGCPKRMVHGPCGGVRSDLGCEVVPLPCPFVRLAGARAWTGGPSGTVRAPSVVLDRVGPAPVVLTDLTTEPYDRAGTTAVLQALRGSCDAVLVAEHQDQPDFPPTLTAAVLRDAGVPGWITLTCRDRNAVVLEQELAGLAEVGVDGVLCVTGDARAPGVRSGVRQVFDLDSTRLAARAAGAGLAVGVVESVQAPPIGVRPGRLLAKQRAGAHLAVLNHVSSAAALASFAAAARAVGVSVPIVAAVAVYTDERSAKGLLGFPGLH